MFADCRKESMKKILLGVFLAFILIGCGIHEDEEEKEINVVNRVVEPPAQATLKETEFSWDNTTIFRYDDIEYDLQEIAQGVNAIKWCKKVGGCVVINGHVGPNNGHYFIFNTETKAFEKILSGTNLVWHSDDVRTSVYTFWNEIYTYEGELIAKCEMDQFDMIRSITFIEDNTKIEVKISPNYGEEYTIEFTLPEE